MPSRSFGHGRQHPVRLLMRRPAQRRVTQRRHRHLSIAKLASSSSSRRSHRTANRDRRSLGPPTAYATRKSRRNDQPISAITPEVRDLPRRGRACYLAATPLPPRGLPNPPPARSRYVCPPEVGKTAHLGGGPGPRSPLSDREGFDSRPVAMPLLPIPTGAAPETFRPRSSLHRGLQNPAWMPLCCHSLKRGSSPITIRDAPARSP